MKKIILSIAIPSLIALTLFMCSKQEDKQELKQEVALDETAVAVSLRPVKTTSIALPVNASGLVSTKNEARLAFKIGGVVKGIYAAEGQSVQKGQLLASLDLTEIEAQVSQAKNNVDKLKRDLERVKRLHQDSAATLEMLQNVQTGYDVAVDGLRVAEFNREYATIKAPATGKILQKLLNEGELAAPGSPVFMMNATGPGEWIVKLGLADVDWVRIQKGDKAVITSDAFAGQTISGQVSLIGEGADPFSGLYPVEVTIANTSNRLASGLFATVEIVPTKATEFQQIPIEAIVEGSGKAAFVFIPKADQKSVEQRKIKVAFIKDGAAFITDGLSGVTNVITSGSGFLTETSAIKISAQ
jgi:membrane fusion protein, multidrug efflux system